MSGYFSRLVKQSGIAVGPPIDPGSRVPVLPPKGLGEGGATTPTHVDREELVKPQGDDPTKETQEGSEADSGPIVEEQNPTKAVLHRKAPEVPRHPSERREFDARDSIRELPEKGEVAEGGAGRPVVFVRKALERDEIIEGTTHRAGERSLGAKASGEEPQDRTSREQVWQNTLREARGWVAGSPVADDEEAENRDVSRARGTPSINTDSLFVEERVAPSHPKSTAPSPREEPATQDLRLEIGTISVTVEEPQKEIPKSSRRTGTAEKKTAVNNERSRLSRHYVRVR